MHILVTNDDGVTAPGLLALAQAMRSVGTVSVLAPDHNWSASGHVKTLHRPLRAKTVLLADGTEAMTSDGAPSDCVALAGLGLISSPVDLVVSGINPGINVGYDLTYSGTVTAAMEAVIWGTPGISFSMESPEDLQGPLDFSHAAGVAQRVAAMVLKNGLPLGTLLNVNIPYRPANDPPELVITRQGMRIYRDELIRREDPRGKPYYWIGGEVPTGVVEEGTDFGTLAAGKVSITPIMLDLTAYQAIDVLRGWTWDV
jgi:5'-nucleotidase